MSYKNVFRRYELKYLLTEAQKDAVLSGMEGHMMLDRYGRTTIRNLYFDNESYRLIRRSLEKPDYKEKLRIRSYQQSTSDSTVFVELKKKYNGVVYKRRVDVTEAEAMAWVGEGASAPRDTQITREIDYFMSHYGRLYPSVYLSYEREAYYDVEGSDFRVTFDDNIFARRDRLSLCEEADGLPILPNGRVLMEIKCPGAIPLWMVDLLSSHRIYKTSFSKYGRAYTEYILPTLSDYKNCSKEILINV